MKGIPKKLGGRLRWGECCEEAVRFRGGRRLCGQGDRNLFHFLYYRLHLKDITAGRKLQAPRRGLHHYLAPRRRHSLLLGTNCHASAVGIT